MRIPISPKLFILFIAILLSFALNASPVNDDCSLAISLELSESALSFDSNGATNSAAPDPSCDYYDGGDVWFNVMMPMSGHLSVETLSGTNSNPCVALYVGNCSDLLEYDCRYDGSDTNNGGVNIHDQELGGQEIFIRVFQYNTGVGGAFNIRAHEPDIPDNDFCLSAVTINVGQSCSTTLFTNKSTTDSPAGIGATCGYRGADVWFRAKVPASGKLILDAMGIDNPDPVIAVFVGDCNNLGEYDCQKNDSPTDDARIIINDLELADKYIYFNVFRYFNRNGGSFELCAYEPVIPSSDFCYYATEIDINTNCTPTTYTNAFTTTSSQDEDPSCGLFSGGDVWFKFDIPDSGNLSIDIDPGTNALPHMALYTGTCNNVDEYDCAGYGYTGDQKIIISDQSLVGQTMYLRVFQYYERNGGTFDLCIKEPAVPNNDMCGSAIGLQVGGDATTFSNEYATSSNQADEPNCGEYDGGDVWFNFIMPTSGHLVVDAINGTNNDPVLAVYTGGCGSFELYDCHLGGVLAGYSRMMLHDEALAGQLLYLRVFESENESGGSFELSLFEPSIPDNDFCNAAIDLGTPTAQCNVVTYTNEYTTPSENAPTPSCGNYQGGDVWFSVNVPASGHLAIDAMGGTNQDPVVNLYTGACGNFTQYDCQYRGGPNNESRIIVHDASLAGQKLYIRAYRYFHREGGTFNLCTFEPNIPNNDFCSAATNLGTIGLECTQTTYTNEYTTSNTAMPAPSCGVYQGGDVWYTLQMPASGHLAIDAFGGANNDPTLTIYTGTCGNISEYDCRDTGSPSDNGRIVIHDENLAGQVLYLRAYQYYSKNGGTFDLCMYEPNIPENDFCVNAIELPVGNTCNMVTYTNALTTDSPQTAPACGLYRGGDVWFKTQVPASGRLVIDTDNNEIQPVVALYTGSCDIATPYTCNVGSSLNDNGGKVFVNNSTMAGQTIYIRVFQFYNRSGGDFNLCLFEPSIPVNQDCSAAEWLAVSQIPDYKLFSNEFSSTEIDSDPSCGTYQGGEIWFKATIPESGKLTLDTREVQIDNADMSIYLGTCDGLIEIACDDNSGVGNMAKVSIDNLDLVGQTVFVQIWRNSSPYGGFFGISSHESGALAVELLNFKAEAINNRRVQLDWITASETNNNHFDVEHSADGISFVSIGKLDGAGTTEVQQIYQHIHAQPVPGINYYRLKDVEFDGTFNYSSTISANIEKPEREVTVSPNPFDSEIILYFDKSLEYNALVQLTDVHGRIVMEERLPQGTVNHYVDTSSLLEKGVYFLTILDEDFQIRKYAGKFLRN